MLTTKPKDLRPDLAEIIHKILKDNLEEGTYVFAFGSRANWTAKQSSDLDLAIDSFGEKLNQILKMLFKSLTSHILSMLLIIILSLIVLEKLLRMIWLGYFGIGVLLN